MHIAIDAHAIGMKLGGNTIYAQNLILALARLDKRNQYTLYLNPEVKLDLPTNYRQVKIHTKNRYLRSLYLSYRLKIDRPDIYHGQYFLPFYCTNKAILTIHDICAFTHPQWFNLAERFIFRFLPWAIRRANKIITISDFSKRELINRFNLEEDKVSVVNYGVDRVFKPYRDQASLAGIKIKYSLPHNYILYVGRFNIRKNISGLLKAFSLFRESDQNNYKLVLVGRPHGKGLNPKQLVARLNLEKEVIFLDYLVHTDLPLVYSAAKLFVFPSFYEGFGLPVLEALVSGTPTIVSDIPVFSELFNDTVLKVNPRDITAMAETMKVLISDAPLRERLISAGLKLSSQFSWQRAVESTLQIYQEVL